jgi:uncharacterized protein (TIGR03067 family)
MNGTYKVDPSKSPKTIDITFTGGQLDGLTMLGVYELEAIPIRFACPPTVARSARRRWPANQARILCSRF